MNIVSEYDDFKNEIEEIFSDNIEIAKKWQCEEVPEDLYYNHGEYMNKNSRDSIEYIIKQLKNNSTSSRAIIPLIDINDVIESGDDFLPSLNIIQFGFKEDKKEELYINVYLRALEVNHFLKINISEIYLLCEKIKKSIRSINGINLTIYAFRAQYKQKFGCFKKAKIDRINCQELAYYVYDKENEKIIELLDEKLELQETVIHVDGLKNLKESIDILNKKNESNYYNQDLCDKLSELIKYMEELKEESQNTSLYRDLEDKQKSIDEKMKSLINEFEKLGEVKK